MSLFSDMVDKWSRQKAFKWGKAWAEKILQIFNAYKVQFPEMSDKELYYLTIQSLPEISPENAIRIVDRTINFAEGNIPTLAEPLSLRSVVKGLLIHEKVQQVDFKGRSLPRYFLVEAFMAVDVVIPEQELNSAPKPKIVTSQPKPKPDPRQQAAYKAAAGRKDRIYE